MTQQPDDLVERLKYNVKHGMFDAANAGKHVSLLDLLKRIAADASTITALRQRVAELEAAVLAEQEACAKVCEDQIKIFLSPKYAAGQPMSSFGERFACGRCAQEIRNRSNDHAG